jgi:hypothetical protein
MLGSGRVRPEALARIRARDLRERGPREATSKDSAEDRDRTDWADGPDSPRAD